MLLGLLLIIGLFSSVVAWPSGQPTPDMATFKAEFSGLPPLPFIHNPGTSVTADLTITYSMVFVLDSWILNYELPFVNITEFDSNGIEHSVIFNGIYPCLQGTDLNPVGYLKRTMTGQSTFAFVRNSMNFISGSCLIKWDMNPFINTVDSDKEYRWRMRPLRTDGKNYWTLTMDTSILTIFPAYHRHHIRLTPISSCTDGSQTCLVRFRFDSDQYKLLKMKNHFGLAPGQELACRDEFTHTIKAILSYATPDVESCDNLSDATEKAACEATPLEYRIIDTQQMHVKFTPDAEIIHNAENPNTFGGIHYRDWFECIASIPLHLEAHAGHDTIPTHVLQKDGTFFSINNLDVPTIAPELLITTHYNICKIGSMCTYSFKFDRKFAVKAPLLSFISPVTATFTTPSSRHCILITEGPNVYIQVKNGANLENLDESVICELQFTPVATRLDPNTAPSIDVTIRIPNEAAIAALLPETPTVQSYLVAFEAIPTFINFDLYKWWVNPPTSLKTGRTGLVLGFNFITSNFLVSNIHTSNENLCLGQRECEITYEFRSPMVLRSISFANHFHEIDPNTQLDCFDTLGSVARVTYSTDLSTVTLTPFNPSKGLMTGWCIVRYRSGYVSGPDAQVYHHYSPQMSQFYPGIDLITTDEAFVQYTSATNSDLVKYPNYSPFKFNIEHGFSQPHSRDSFVLFTLFKYEGVEENMVNIKINSITLHFQDSATKNMIFEFFQTGCEVYTRDRLIISPTCRTYPQPDGIHIVFTHSMADQLEAFSLSYSLGEDIPDRVIGFDLNYSYNLTGDIITNHIDVDMGDLSYVLTTLATPPMALIQNNQQYPEITDLTTFNPTTQTERLFYIINSGGPTVFNITTSADLIQQNDIIVFQLYYQADTIRTGLYITMPTILNDGAFVYINQVDLTCDFCYKYRFVGGTAFNGNINAPITYLDTYSSLDAPNQVKFNFQVLRTSLVTFQVLGPSQTAQFTTVYTLLAPPRIVVFAYDVTTPTFTSASGGETVVTTAGSPTQLINNGQRVASFETTTFRLNIHPIQAFWPLDNQKDLENIKFSKNGWTYIVEDCSGYIPTDPECYPLEANTGRYQCSSKRPLDKDGNPTGSPPKQSFTFTTPATTTEYPFCKITASISVSFIHAPEFIQYTFLFPYTTALLPSIRLYEIAFPRRAMLCGVKTFPVLYAGGGGIYTINMPYSSFGFDEIRDNPLYSLMQNSLIQYTLRVSSTVKTPIPIYTTMYCPERLSSTPTFTYTYTPFSGVSLESSYTIPRNGFFVYSPPTNVLSRILFPLSQILQIPSSGPADPLQLPSAFLSSNFHDYHITLAAPSAIRHQIFAIDAKDSHFDMYYSTSLYNNTSGKMEYHKLSVPCRVWNSARDPTVLELRIVDDIIIFDPYSPKIMRSDKCLTQTFADCVSELGVGGVMNLIPLSSYNDLITLNMCHFTQCTNLIQSNIIINNELDFSFEFNPGYNSTQVSFFRLNRDIDISDQVTICFSSNWGRKLMSSQTTIASHTIVSATSTKTDGSDIWTEECIQIDFAEQFPRFTQIEFSFGYILDFQFNSGQYLPDMDFFVDPAHSVKIVVTYSHFNGTMRSQVDSSYIIDLPDAYTPITHTYTPLGYSIAPYDQDEYFVQFDLTLGRSWSYGQRVSIGPLRAVPAQIYTVEFDGRPFLINTSDYIDPTATFLFVMVEVVHLSQNIIPIGTTVPLRLPGLKLQPGETVPTLDWIDCLDPIKAPFVSSLSLGVKNAPLDPFPLFRHDFRIFPAFSVRVVPEQVTDNYWGAQTYDQHCTQGLPCNHVITLIDVTVETPEPVPFNLAWFNTPNSLDNTAHIYFFIEDAFGGASQTTFPGYTTEVNGVSISVGVDVPALLTNVYSLFIVLPNNLDVTKVYPVPPLTVPITFTKSGPAANIRSQITTSLSGIGNQSSLVLSKYADLTAQNVFFKEVLPKQVESHFFYVNGGLYVNEPFTIGFKPNMYIDSSVLFAPDLPSNIPAQAAIFASIPIGATDFNDWPITGNATTINEQYVYTGVSPFENPSSAPAGLMFFEKFTNSTHSYLNLAVTAWAPTSLSHAMVFRPVSITGTIIPTTPWSLPISSQLNFGGHFEHHNYNLRGVQPAGTPVLDYHYDRIGTGKVAPGVTRDAAEMFQVRAQPWIRVRPSPDILIFDTPTDVTLIISFQLPNGYYFVQSDYLLLDMPSYYSISPSYNKCVDVDGNPIGALMEFQISFFVIHFDPSWVKVQNQSMKCTFRTTISSARRSTNLTVTSARFQWYSGVDSIAALAGRLPTINTVREDGTDNPEKQQIPELQVFLPYAFEPPQYSMTFIEVGTVNTPGTLQFFIQNSTLRNGSTITFLDPIPFAVNETTSNCINPRTGITVASIVLNADHVITLEVLSAPNSSPTFTCSASITPIAEFVHNNANFPLRARLTNIGPAPSVVTITSRFFNSGVQISTPKPNLELSGHVIKSLASTIVLTGTNILSQAGNTITFNIGVLSMLSSSASPSSTSPVYCVTDGGDPLAQLSFAFDGSISSFVKTYQDLTAAQFAALSDTGRNGAIAKIRLTFLREIPASSWRCTFTVFPLSSENPRQISAYVSYGTIANKIITYTQSNLPITNNLSFSKLFDIDLSLTHNNTLTSRVSEVRLYYSLSSLASQSSTTSGLFLTLPFQLASLPESVGVECRTPFHGRRSQKLKFTRYASSALQPVYFLPIQMFIHQSSTDLNFLACTIPNLSAVTGTFASDSARFQVGTPAHDTGSIPLNQISAFTLEYLDPSINQFVMVSDRLNDVISLQSNTPTKFRFTLDNISYGDAVRLTTSPNWSLALEDNCFISDDKLNSKNNVLLGMDSWGQYALKQNILTPTQCNQTITAVQIQTNSEIANAHLVVELPNNMLINYKVNIMMQPHVEILSAPVLLMNYFTPASYSFQFSGISNTYMVRLGYTQSFLHAGSFSIVNNETNTIFDCIHDEINRIYICQGPFTPQHTYIATFSFIVLTNDDYYVEPLPLTGFKIVFAEIASPSTILPGLLELSWTVNSDMSQITPQQKSWFDAIGLQSYSPENRKIPHYTITYPLFDKPTEELISGELYNFTIQMENIGLDLESLSIPLFSVNRADIKSFSDKHQINRWFTSTLFASPYRPDSSMYDPESSLYSSIISQHSSNVVDLVPTQCINTKFDQYSPLFTAVLWLNTSNYHNNEMKTTEYDNHLPVNVVMLPNRKAIEQYLIWQTEHAATQADVIECSFTVALTGDVSSVPWTRPRAYDTATDPSNPIDLADVHVLSDMTYIGLYLDNALSYGSNFARIKKSIAKPNYHGFTAIYGTHLYKQYSPVTFISPQVSIKIAIDNYALAAGKSGEINISMMGSRIAMNDVVLIKFHPVNTDKKLDYHYRLSLVAQKLGDSSLATNNFDLGDNVDLTSTFCYNRFYALDTSQRSAPVATLTAVNPRTLNLISGVFGDVFLLRILQNVGYGNTFVHALSCAANLLAYNKHEYDGKITARFFTHTEFEALKALPPDQRDLGLELPPIAPSIHPAPPDSALTSNIVGELTTKIENGIDIVTTLSPITPKQLEKTTLTLKFHAFPILTDVFAVANLTQFKFAAFFGCTHNSEFDVVADFYGDIGGIMVPYHQDILRIYLPLVPEEDLILECGFLTSRIVPDVYFKQHNHSTEKDDIITNLSPNQIAARQKMQLTVKLYQLLNPQAEEITSLPKSRYNLLSKFYFPPKTQHQMLYIDYPSLPLLKTHTNAFQTTYSAPSIIRTVVFTSPFRTHDNLYLTSEERTAFIKVVASSCALTIGDNKLYTQFGPLDINILSEIFDSTSRDLAITVSFPKVTTDELLQHLVVQAIDIDAWIAQVYSQSGVAITLPSVSYPKLKKAFSLEPFTTEYPYFDELCRSGVTGGMCGLTPPEFPCYHNSDCRIGYYCHQSFSQFDSVGVQADNIAVMKPYENAEVLSRWIRDGVYFANGLCKPNGDTLDNSLIQFQQQMNQHFMETSSSVWIDNNHLFSPNSTSFDPPYSSVPSFSQQTLPTTVFATIPDEYDYTDSNDGGNFASFATNRAAQILEDSASQSSSVTISAFTLLISLACLFF